MNPESTPQPSCAAKGSRGNSRWLWFLAAAGALVLVLFLAFRPLQESDASKAAPANTNGIGTKKGAGNSAVGTGRRLGRHSNSDPSRSAEEIVAAKVRQFGRNRRELVRKIARRLNKDVPPGVEKFFDAIESGDWVQIEAQWHELATHSFQYDWSTDGWEDLNPFWESVLDAYGVAEQAHDWPARQLLDYGNAILDSLRPGMVYVGGTDNGRWIPELLNETGDGPQRIMVTQNAFADGRYLDYMSELYGDRFAALTHEESQRAFQEYTADFQKRLEHDQQFPEEPRQVRPGENYKMEDGRIQVSGQVAVMGINEKLLQMMMAKNPDLSFAIQESFPLRGTYPGALPLGPLMELGARDAQNSFTAARAAESVAYWKSTAEQALADPETAGSTPALKSYSHDTAAAANLLAAHNFTAEAEQAYRVAMQLWPANPESTAGLADLLDRYGRQNEARQLLDDFNRKFPDQQKDLERMTVIWQAPRAAGSP